MSKEYKKDSLGDRMKAYEDQSEVIMPMDKVNVIRLDGRAFHTYTKNMKRPFDEKLSSAMKATLKFLCENIPTVCFGYTQSDEITLVLKTDKVNGEYNPWFGNRLQKILTTAVSLCTFEFNRLMYDERRPKMATFDGRVIVGIDYVEAANNVFWRQLDAKRNSVSSFAQANFPHKELQGLKWDSLKEKLRVEAGIVWEDQCAYEKWGVVCKRNEKGSRGWMLDEDTPLLNSDWSYIYDEIKPLDVD